MIHEVMMGGTYEALAAIFRPQAEMQSMIMIMMAILSTIMIMIIIIVMAITIMVMMILIGSLIKVRIDDG